MCRQRRRVCQRPGSGAALSPVLSASAAATWLAVALRPARRLQPHALEAETPCAYRHGEDAQPERLRVALAMRGVSIGLIGFYCAFTFWGLPSTLKAEAALSLSRGRRSSPPLPLGASTAWLLGAHRTLEERPCLRGAALLLRAHKEAKAHGYPPWPNVSGPKAFEAMSSASSASEASL